MKKLLLIVALMPLSARAMSTHIFSCSLTVSAEVGNFEDVKKRITAGEDVNKVDGDGFSAFYLACQNNYQEIAEYLLEHGADSFLMPQGGIGVATPMHYAISYVNLELCEAMLKQICLKHMPCFNKASFERIFAVLCLFKLRGELPAEVRNRILCSDPELGFEVLGILFGSDKNEPIADKIARARVVLGSEACGRLLSIPCREDIHALLSLMSGFSGAVFWYAQRCYENAAQRANENSIERSHQIALLLNPDSLKERLPGLILKWFAPQDDQIEDMSE